MKIKHLDTAERYEPQPDWLRVSLCDEPDVSIEYFVKPPHHASPVHDHPQQQVTVVLRGAMKAVDGQGHEELLGEGDAAYFAAGEPHQLVNALETTSVGIDVFCPARSFDFWKKRLG